MAVDATAIIGLLVGFLVVGIVGTYVGDQMITATNLTEAHAQESATWQNVSALTGWGTWTAPTGVTSVDIMVVGAGGGGGSANNGTEKGGTGGGAATVTSSTKTVTPGTTYRYFLGTRGAIATAGTASNITIGASEVSAAGGAAGTTGTTPNGTSGTQATLTGFTSGSTVTTATAGVGNVTNNTLGGSAAAGLGGGGGGAGFEGVAGVGGHGGIQISYTTYTDTTLAEEGMSQLVDSRDSIIATFALGVLLCKIIIIVSIASIVFVLLQKTGLIPRFGQE